MSVMTRPRLFEYLCSNRHAIQAPTEQVTCPACIDGRPCDGTLTRVGLGSRGKRT